MADDIDPDLTAQAEALLAAMGPRRRATPRLHPSLADVPVTMIPHDGGEIAAWRIGEGPAVMLIHGWEDSHGLWAGMIKPLTAAGRSLVLLDLPQHGLTTIDGPTAYHAALALLAVRDVLGPIDSVLTHSFGGAAAIRAMGMGLEAQRCVFIAGNVQSGRRNWRDSYLERGVSAEVLDVLEVIFEQRLGQPLGIYDIAADVKKTTAEALFIWTEDDKVVSPKSTQALAAIWPNARTLSVSGPDHRKVVRDPAVVAATVEFLKPA